MDTKVIGRGVQLPPGEAPEIRIIYARDLTRESEGNALGVGMADLIHERLYRKIDLEKMYVNARTSLNLPMPRVPMYVRSDYEAIELGLASAGSPEPGEQRVVCIRNTLSLEKIL